MVKQVLSILNRGEKIKLVILFFMVGLGSILELLGVSAFSPLINLITDPSIIHTKWYLEWLYLALRIQDTRRFLSVVILIIIAIYIIKNVYLIWERNILYRYIFNVQKRVSVKLLKAYLNEPYSFFLTRNTAVLQRSLQSDTDSFVKAIKHFLELMIEAITCVVIIVYLFLVSHSMTIIIAVILVGLVGFFALTTKKKTQKLGRDSQKYKAEIYQYMNQALGGVKEIKVLNREHTFLDKYEDSFGKFTYAQRVSEILGMVPKYCVEASCMTGLLVAILLKMYFGQKDLIDFIPQLSVFAIASVRLLPSVGRINQYFTYILYEQPSIALVYHDLQEVESIEEEKKQNQDWKLKSELRICSISYHYPNTDKNVLENASMVIRKGTMVGLVGASGAGKSTLADIILGLLTPQMGKIFADDLDVLKNVHTWQQEIGYIPQVIYLSDDSIRNNIAFGVPEDEIDDTRVRLAAEQAQLADFIDLLPDGYQTSVGDRGIRLSGGQRQRIGIARALYNDPELLILDEATSALDHDTETAVMEAIDHLQGQKTMIIIAHRLSTIANADCIYEVADGKIVPRTKEELGI
mgnify:CR=1 FL=1